MTGGLGAGCPGHTIDAVADAIVEPRRLTEIYDPLDPDRSDLDVYLGLADRLGGGVSWTSAAARGRLPAF
jgi:hypothetical protein